MNTHVQSTVMYRYKSRTTNTDSSLSQNLFKPFTKPVKMLWKGLTLFAIFLISKLSAAEVSEKEYALMPPLFHLDNYDSCMLHGDEALYCMVTIQLFPINPNNTSKIWKIIEVCLLSLILHFRICYGNF
jgi:hypothetical protein